MRRMHMIQFQVLIHTKIMRMSVAQESLRNDFQFLNIMSRNQQFMVPPIKLITQSQIQYTCN